jgi:hypothetical protein
LVKEFACDLRTLNGIRKTHDAVYYRKLGKLNEYCSINCLHSNCLPRLLTRFNFIQDPVISNHVLLYQINKILISTLPSPSILLLHLRGCVIFCNVIKLVQRIAEGMYKIII